MRTGQASAGFFYGMEYTREDIEWALQSQEPYSVVPSRDTKNYFVRRAFRSLDEVYPNREWGIMVLLCQVSKKPAKLRVPLISADNKIDYDTGKKHIERLKRKNR